MYRQHEPLNETRQHFDVNPAVIDAFQILVTNGTYTNGIGWFAPEDLAVLY